MLGKKHLLMQRSAPHVYRHRPPPDGRGPDLSVRDPGAVATVDGPAADALGHPCPACGDRARSGRNPAAVGGSVLAHGRTRLPPLPCPHCGVLDIPRIAPGRGPHIARLDCAACGTFVKWAPRAFVHPLSRKETLRMGGVNRT